MDLRDRVVLITGASGGIGAATARRCAARGARLALVARRAGPLEALAAEIGAGRALAIPADVSDADAVEAMAATAIGRLGRVDVLVNGAGLAALDRFDQARAADIDAMLRVNLGGTLHCTRALLPGMLERRSGQVVNLASLAGLVAMGGLAGYSASKFGVVGFSRVLQVELRGSGVRCALISPTVVRTAGFWQGNLEKLPRFARLVPWQDEAAVADAALRAIERDLMGELTVPGYARPLMSLAGLLPGVQKWLAGYLG